jgi:glycosyltransferase involved in cell wall biosynthesis
VRVLLVNDWVPHEGGVETYVSGLRESLEARGDEVKLLTSSVGSQAGGSAEYVARGARAVVPQAALQVVNPFAAASARAAVRDFRPDVAHVSMFEMHLSPAVLTALRPVPTLLSIAYYKPVCPTGLKVWPDGRLCTQPAGLVCWRSGCLSLPHWLRDQARYALIRRELDRVAMIVTCSPWMEGQLAAEGVEAQALDWPVRPPAPGYRRARAEEPVFVYLGRLSPEKGVDVLLDAFDRLRTRMPSAQLRIVGDGPQRRALEALGVGGVTFTGSVAETEIDGMLADAWALVVPSRWAEPFGLVAAEAILRGVPVIASATGGLAGTVELGVNGLLFPNGDVEALYRLLEDVAAGRSLGADAPPADAIERIRTRHDPGRHVDHLRSLFAAIADAR